MTTENANTNISIDWISILQGVSQLDNQDLHIFTKEVVQLLLQRVADTSMNREWVLIQQIYSIVPPDVLVRQNQLATKVELASLNEEEREEYLSLNEQLEQLSADRLELMIGLAQIRQVSVREVMEQLGIQAPSYA